jgi:hypothetical protein
VNPELQLRDIHLPPEPSWWPPAPGWWVLAALVILAAWWTIRALRKRALERRRAAALRAAFDAAAAISAPAEKLAAISELLRRAAPSAATLHGEDWLRFLGEEFSAGPGRVLLDGPYRAALDDDAAAAAVAPARKRFAELVEPRA